MATFTSPVFNLEPNPGEPARFGFLPTEETPAFIDTSVKTGGDYGIIGESDNIEQNAGVLHAQVTLWGVPGSPAHDDARGFECIEIAREQLEKGEFDRARQCTSADQHNPPPFFDLPTSCTGQPLVSIAEADPWDEPGNFVKVSTYPVHPDADPGWLQPPALRTVDQGHPGCAKREQCERTPRGRARPAGIRSLNATSLRSPPCAMSPSRCRKVWR